MIPPPPRLQKIEGFGPPMAIDSKKDGEHDNDLPKDKERDNDLPRGKERDNDDLSKDDVAVISTFIRLAIS